NFGEGHAQYPDAVDHVCRNEQARSGSNLHLSEESQAKGHIPLLKSLKIIKKYEQEFDFSRLIIDRLREKSGYRVFSLMGGTTRPPDCRWTSEFYDFRQQLLCKRDGQCDSPDAQLSFHPGQARYGAGFRR